MWQRESFALMGGFPTAKKEVSERFLVLSVRGVEVEEGSYLPLIFNCEREGKGSSLSVRPMPGGPNPVSPALQ